MDTEKMTLTQWESDLEAPLFNGKGYRSRKLAQEDWEMFNQARRVLNG